MKRNLKKPKKKKEKEKETEISYVCQWKKKNIFVKLN